MPSALFDLVFSLVALVALGFAYSGMRLTERKFLAYRTALQAIADMPVSSGPPESPYITEAYHAKAIATNALKWTAAREVSRGTTLEEQLKRAGHIPPARSYKDH